MQRPPAPPMLLACLLSVSAAANDVPPAPRGFTAPAPSSEGRRFGPPPPSTGPRHAAPVGRRRARPFVVLIERVPVAVPAPLAADPAPPPPVMMTTSDGVRMLVDAPFLCFLDKRGFAARDEFTRHLNDEHGVPTERAMALSTVVGGDHIVFFGDGE